MEGINLAGIVDSYFEGIHFNFAPPRPTGFANFRGWRGKTCFFTGGAGQPFSTGRGGAHIFGKCHIKASMMVASVRLQG